MSDENYTPDEQEQRIITILAPGQLLDDLPEVNAKTLKKYHHFLQQYLPTDVSVMGRESMGYFSWEERFEFGDGDEATYNRLRIQRGSYRDKYRFIRLGKIDAQEGSIADLMRHQDKKLFHIPLADLEVCKMKLSTWKIVDDYAMWVTNYCE